MTALMEAGGRLPAAAPRETEPLEVLYENPPAQAGNVRGGLTATLSRAYGGDLAIPLWDDRPTVIANFVETLDGAVALDRRGRTGGGAVSGFSRIDRFVMGLLRAMADVVIVGAGTLRASRGAGWTPARAYPEATDDYAAFRHDNGLAPDPLTLIVTARGDVDPGHPAFQDPAQPIVIAAPAATSERLRQVGFRDGVRIESLGDGEALAPATWIALAERLGARLILSEGGPHLFGGLLGTGLVDELFLTLAPQLVGRDPNAQRMALIEGVALWPDRPTWGQLASIRRGGDHIFLRYRFSEVSS